MHVALRSRRYYRLVLAVNLLCVPVLVWAWYPELADWRDPRALVELGVSAVTVAWCALNVRDAVWALRVLSR